MGHELRGRHREPDRSRDERGERAPRGGNVPDRDRGRRRRPVGGGLDRRRAPPGRSGHSRSSTVAPRRSTHRRRFTADGVWVSVAPNAISRVDPSGPSLTSSRRPVGSGPTSVCRAFGSIWVANPLDGTVTPARSRRPVASRRRSPSDRARTRSRRRASRSGWPTSSSDTVTTIDRGATTWRGPWRSVPRRHRSPPTSERLWLAVGASATEHRGGTLTISADRRAPDSLDPALATPSRSGRSCLHNDGLLALQEGRRPRRRHARPGPRLGAARGVPGRPHVPLPAARGISLLDRRADPARGLPPRARAHARACTRPGPAGSHRERRTAPPGSRRSATCRRQSWSTRHRHVPSRHARPRLPFKLALPFAYPVPADIPPEDQGLDPLPATGPYMSPGPGAEGFELARNAAFQEWSAAAQPDGFVDAISWLFDRALGERVPPTAGRAIDVMVGEPGRRTSQLRRSTHPDQVCRGRPGHGVRRVDTLKPPFDDEQVRQAVNYRARPRTPRRAPRRSDDPARDLPDLPAELPGLRAVLPVHHRARERRLVGPRSGPSAGADRGGRRRRDPGRRPHQ